jgi:hypothetical protein
MTTTTAVQATITLTTIGYRIHNISGVTTFHARHFRNDATAAEAFVRSLRKPWISHVTTSRTDVLAFPWELDRRDNHTTKETS